MLLSERGIVKKAKKCFCFWCLWDQTESKKILPTRGSESRPASVDINRKVRPRVTRLNVSRITNENWRARSLHFNLNDCSLVHVRWIIVLPLLGESLRAFGNPRFDRRSRFASEFSPSKTIIIVLSILFLQSVCVPCEIRDAAILNISGRIYNRSKQYHHNLAACLGNHVSLRLLL